MTLIGLILLYGGVLVAVIGVLGLFRFRNPYTRVKALALLNFPAAIFIHAGSSFLVPFSEGGTRGLITAFLFLLSGPVLSHVILLSAHLTKVPRDYAVDDLRRKDEETELKGGSDEV